jgi:uncharacterized membrane-anchored protein
MNRFTASLLLPIVVLLGWIVKIETGLRTGTTMRIDVQGYDPRDLLSGHYLQYSLSTGSVAPCESYQTSAESCLCYLASPGENKYKASWGGDCDKKPADCKIFIKGSCSYGQFESGANRYYIPEAYSERVRTAPPNSSIDVVVSADGTVLVKNFYVGDKTLEQHLSH